MPSKRLTRVREWIATHGAVFIGEAELSAMRADLADIPEASLRKLLREVGIPLAPLVQGVLQDSFDDLAQSLIALEREYETGDAELRRRVRWIVITAKDHAKLASIRKPEKKQMVEWMLVWLDNPPVFETWWRLHAGVSGQTPGSTDTAECPTTS